MPTRFARFQTFPMKKARAERVAVTFYLARIRTRFTTTHADGRSGSEHGAIRRVLYKQSIRIEAPAFVVIDLLPGRFDWDMSNDGKIETIPTYLIAALCEEKELENTLELGLRTNTPRTEK